MRHLVLGTFLICAACGGASNPGSGAVSQDPADRAARTRVANSAEAQATIAKYEQLFGQDAVESCLQAWESDVAADPNAQISKPDFGGLRAFLSECLGAPAP